MVLPVARWDMSSWDVCSTCSAATFLKIRLEWYQIIIKVLLYWAMCLFESLYYSFQHECDGNGRTEIDLGGCHVLKSGVAKDAVFCYVTRCFGVSSVWHSKTANL